jgi:adenylate cyclase
MPKEIERKFLIEPEAWKQLDKPEGKHYKQGYIHGPDDVTIRIRIAESKGYITLKSNTVGISREEFEYEIPYEEAIDMMTSFTQVGTEKIRYKIPAGNLIWEVDEFLGKNAGLLLAEIELEDEDQAFDKPSWLGEEVSSDHRYFNSNLATHPFCDWEKG